MNELDRVNQFIVAKLGADVELVALVGNRIYLDQAPQDTSFPIVVFRAFLGPDTMANGGVRVLASPLYLVFGVTQGDSMLAVAAIADRIDAVLHLASGAAGDDAYVGQMQREGTYELTIEENGILYRQVGGQYRSVVYAT